MKEAEDAYSASCMTLPTPKMPRTTLASSNSSIMLHDEVGDTTTRDATLTGYMTRAPSISSIELLKESADTCFEVQSAIASKLVKHGSASLIHERKVSNLADSKAVESLQQRSGS